LLEQPFLNFVEDKTILKVKSWNLKPELPLPSLK
jgi:hypothetical protein